MGKVIMQGDPTATGCVDTGGSALPSTLYDISEAEDRASDGCDGDNDALERFKTGVESFSEALSAANAISLCSSPFLPYAMNRFGTSRVWAASECLHGVLMLGMFLCPVLPWIRPATRSSVAIMLQALMGLPWAAQMTIPYSIIGRTYQKEPDLGLYMATMNLALCVSQLSMSVLSPILLSMFDLQVVFGVSTPLALVASFKAFRIHVPWEQQVATAP